jgi:hypothetical protein
MPKPGWPTGGTRRSPRRKRGGSSRCRPVRDHRSMARDTGRLRRDRPRRWEQESDSPGAAAAIAWKACVRPATREMAP